MQEREKQKERRQQNDSNILVAIRVRPLNPKEITVGDSDIIRAQDNLIIVLDPVDVEFEMGNKEMLGVLHRSKQQRYAFDKIYRRDQPSELIYEETTKSLVKTVIEGKNATVFAYGPTGTGKTYTMLGNKDTYSLNVLAIRDVFSLIEIDNEHDYSVIITYVEIYNQMIRDLLIPASSYLELRDDGQKGISIAGVTQFRAQSTEQVMELLLIGNKRRTTQATNANQTSSRSHAVFQINVNKTPRTRNINVQTLSGKLSLIDLAGSQRGTVTENRGIRLMEGAKINRSLLALANCINALGDKNKKGFFVPYRDSKLTRLLKDSLGGNCKTVMIANISPASSQFEETINTLKYANRAKNIKTKPLTNKKLVSIHISQYKNIINDLRQQIEQLKTKLENNTTLNVIDANEVQKTDSQNKNLPNKKETSQNCVCGRLEQTQQIKKVKEQIFDNFNQRIQLRRALMQIQQQNAINIIEIKKKQSQLIVLKQAEPEDGSEQALKIAEETKTLTQTIYTLKLSTQKNILKKQITNLQINESMANTRKIRQQIPKRVRSKQNRQFLQIIIKNHVLELQNIQLQINLQIQQKIIYDLKNISENQRKYLEERGLDFKIEQQAIMQQGQDIELQLQQEQQEDNLEDDLEQKIEDLNNQSHCKIIEQTEEKYQDDFQQEEKQLMENEKYIENSIQKKQYKNKQFDDKHFSDNVFQNEYAQNKNTQNGKKNGKDFRQFKKGNIFKRDKQGNNLINRPNQENEDRKKINSMKKQQNLELGVFGINSISKKREKTQTSDLNINSAGIIGNKVLTKSHNNAASSSSNLITAQVNTTNPKQQQVENNQLEFNLKGINLKLNQKLPFTMGPKEKRKK